MVQLKRAGRTSVDERQRQVLGLEVHAADEFWSVVSKTNVPVGMSAGTGSCVLARVLLTDLLLHCQLVFSFLYTYISSKV